MQLGHNGSMRAVVQRCRSANVMVGGNIVGGFEGPGLAILVAATHSDSETVAKKMADKLWNLRLFDANSVRNSDVCVPPNSPKEMSAADLGLPILVVSQFSLYGRTAKGRRPTWEDAAPSAVAEPLIEQVVEYLRNLGAVVSTGSFGADMTLSLVNDGPLTVLVDT